LNVTNLKFTIEILVDSLHKLKYWGDRKRITLINKFDALSKESESEMKTDTEINPQEKHQNKTNQQQNISQQKPGDDGSSNNAFVANERTTQLNLKDNKDFPSIDTNTKDAAVVTRSMIPKYMINPNEKRKKYANSVDRHVNSQYSTVNINNVSKLLEITNEIRKIKQICKLKKIKLLTT
ncbi:hypothetical protein V1477_011429, partial [Vespula maculifrons]